MKQINEIKRMQQLAGVIKESQLNEEPGKTVETPDGNEAIIIKGPVPFSDKIRKEMEDNWKQYAGLEIDNPEATKGNWYYTEVTKVIHGPNNIGEKSWYHEDELSGIVKESQLNENIEMVEKLKELLESALTISETLYKESTDELEKDEFEHVAEQIEMVLNQLDDM